MTTPQGPRKRLPNNPSEENLRKQSKQLAKQEGLQLAAAQRRIAIEYGYHNWAELMRSVASRFVPLVPLRGLIAFPHEVYPIFIGRRKSLNAIKAVEDPKNQIPLATNSPILLVAQRDAAVAAPTPADMYQVGTLGVIVQRERFSDGTVKISVEGRKRARVARFVFGQKFFKAQAEQIEETGRLEVRALDFGLSTSDRSARLETLMRSVLSTFHSYAYGKGRILREKADSIEKIDNPSVLSDRIVGHLNIELAEQQALLESANPIERLEKILGYLEAAN
jgi:ATP-dependent Lon protease